MSPQLSHGMELEQISQTEVSEGVKLRKFGATNKNEISFGEISSSRKANAPELWKALPEELKFDVIFSSGVHSTKTVKDQLKHIINHKKMKKVRVILILRVWGNLA